MITEGRSGAWGAAALTLRQWGTVAGGIVTIVGVLATLVYLAALGAAGLTTVSGLLGLACAAWLVLAWPQVSVHNEGVRVRNPLRTVSVPWARYQGSSAGWTLRVWSERGTHEAFGIAANVDRRSTLGSATGEPMLGRGGLFGRRSDAAEFAGPPAQRPRPRVTPGHVEAVLDQAKAEWVEAVRLGELPGSDAPTRVRWNWLNVAVLAVGVVAALVWAARTLS